jgi:TrmH family RNA methyltransferase
MITSSSNPKIRFIKSLLNRKQDREENRVFVLEGVRLVEEARHSRQEPSLVLFGPNLSPRGKQLITYFKGMQVECEEISEDIMNSLSDTETAQGILVVLPYPKLTFPKNPDFLLIADEIRDPGNLGTILRSSISAGAQAVIITPGTTDAYSPKAVRAGMGSQLTLPIRTMAWSEIEKEFRELSLRFFYATAGEGEPYWKKDFRHPLALILGGEADGVSLDGMRISDEPVRIPMPGQTESLNAAVAASILLFEVVRQRSE